jgi:hypothetical protein
MKRRVRRVSDKTTGNGIRNQYPRQQLYLRKQGASGRIFRKNIEQEIKK